MLSRVVGGRATRWTLVLVLFVATAAAAFFVADIVREHERLLAASSAVDASIAQLGTMASDIGAAQATYIAPGITTEPSIARVASLARQITDASTALRPSLRSEDATRHLQDLSNTLDNLLQVDRQAREEIVDGDLRGSALLIFDDARAAQVSMAGTLRALADSEHATTAAARMALLRRLASIVISVVGVWLIGLLLLVPVPRTRVAPVDQRLDAAAPEPALDLPLDQPRSAVPEPQDDGAAPSATVPEPPATAPAIDLAAAADVCTAIARASSTDQLPALLSRAAAVLDASGIILWLGAGNDLHAVSAHGYDPKLLARLGPIPRQADNATAAAWRSGEFGVVAHEPGSNGAIVAPLLGGDCIGVLTAELRHDRETDPATQAVVTMFAAQVTGLLWPSLAAQSSAAATVSPDHGDSLAASL